MIYWGVEIQFPTITVTALKSVYKINSKVSDQNGISLLYIILAIHHSGREPSKCCIFFWSFQFQLRKSQNKLVTVLQPCLSEGPAESCDDVIMTSLVEDINNGGNNVHVPHEQLSPCVCVCVCVCVCCFGLVRFFFFVRLFVVVVCFWQHRGVDFWGSATFRCAPPYLRPVSVGGRSDRYRTVWPPWLSRHGFFATSVSTWVRPLPFRPVSASVQTL